MKTIELAKRWRHRVNETTVEEYSAGAKVTVSNDRADAAKRAGVLKGDPVDASPEPSGEGEAGTGEPGEGKKGKG